MYNGIAYCTCGVKKGDGISVALTYDGDKNICTLNAEGVQNGYMASYYSLPEAALPGGNKALYTCPGETSSGAYAQCDGAICFQSTRGQYFPGSSRPLNPGQIICSCPVTVASPPASDGYQIAGPYPCRRSYFKNCSSEYSNTNTGAIVYSGAPAGFADLLTKLLYGYLPDFNTCDSPESATLP